MTSNWWVAPFIVIVALAIMRIFYMFRARAMRGFASRLGFQYIGPTAPPQWWWNTSHLQAPPPLPAWVSRLGVTQVWNIIEGKNDGMSVLVFDGIVGSFKSQPRTYIACETAQNPFGTGSSAYCVLEYDGWTVLHGVWFLWFSWIMGTKRLADHLAELGTK